MTTAVHSFILFYLNLILFWFFEYMLLADILSRSLNIFYWLYNHYLSTRISQYLKNRTASASEYQPLNGLDPTTHAEVCIIYCLLFVQVSVCVRALQIEANISLNMYQLALKDAEKLMKFRSNSAKPYFLKASAFILVITFVDIVFYQYK